LARNEGAGDLPGGAGGVLGLDTSAGAGPGDLGLETTSNPLGRRVCEITSTLTERIDACPALGRRPCPTPAPYPDLAGLGGWDDWVGVDGRPGLMLGPSLVLVGIVMRTGERVGRVTAGADSRGLVGDPDRLVAGWGPGLAADFGGDDGMEGSMFDNVGDDNPSDSRGGEDESTADPESTEGFVGEDGEPSLAGEEGLGPGRAPAANLDPERVPPSERAAYML
jgi:hypothetical protein